MLDTVENGTEISSVDPLETVFNAHIARIGSVTVRSGYDTAHDRLLSILKIELQPQEPGPADICEIADFAWELRRNMSDYDHLNVGITFPNDEESSSKIIISASRIEAKRLESLACTIQTLGFKTPAP